MSRVEPQQFRVKPQISNRTNMRDSYRNMDKKIPLEESDYAYYNIRIYNPAEGNTLGSAIYKENRTEPILDKPDDYEIGVVRFSIPASIPIFLFPQTKINGVKTGLPDNTIYRVSLVYVPTNTIITKNVVFVDNCIGCAYPLGVYNYQDFVDAVNLAYADAYTDLKALQPLMPPTEAPFLALDPLSELFSLYAEQKYNDANKTQIWMTGVLYDTYFPSFYSKVDFTTYATPLNVELVVGDTKTNSITYNAKPYYKMSQSFSTLALWNDFVALILESDTIPIEPEYEPSQNNIIRRIITDFEPSVDINNRQNFQFFPQGPIRYYDLKSSYPMRSIDVRVYLQAKDGETYLLRIAPGQYMSIKLQFRRKRELIFKEILDDEVNNE